MRKIVITWSTGKNINKIHIGESLKKKKKVGKIKKNPMFDFVHTSDNSQCNRSLSLSLNRSLSLSLLCIWRRFWQVIKHEDMVWRLHLLGSVHCQVKATMRSTCLFVSQWLVGSIVVEQDLLSSLTHFCLLHESAGFRWNVIVEKCQSHLTLHGISVWPKANVFFFFLVRPNMLQINTLNLEGKSKCIHCKSTWLQLKKIKKKNHVNLKETMPYNNWFINSWSIYQGGFKKC